MRLHFLHHANLTMVQVVHGGFEATRGCTEAVLAAENIPADVLIELVQSGLVIARNEHFEDEDGVVEITRVRITEAGKRVFMARE